MRLNLKQSYLFCFLLLSLKLLAQNDTIFVDQNWKETTKDKAFYYRIKQENKPEWYCGFGPRRSKLLYPINYYHIENNKIYLQAFSTDPEGKNLSRNTKWYDENGKKIDPKDFSDNKDNNSKFKLPILYLDYKVAKKSLFSGGIEFCLNPKNEKNLFLGVGYGITNSYNGNYYGLPDIHLSYNTNRLLFYKAGMSTKNAYVVLGPSFLNLIDLGLGYSQTFSENKIPEIKGFIFNITLRLTSVPKSVPYQKRIIP